MPLMVVQVALLFLCDTLNCAFDITFLYIPLVGNFGTSYASWSWVYNMLMCIHAGNDTSLTYATWGE